MRYILFLFSLLLANVASAIDCDTAPTCEELGYSTEDDPYCAENGYMYCPLDHSYKKCVNMDCAKLGFTESDKTSWCSKLIKCKGNPRMTLCQNLCEVGDVYYADGTCGYAQDYDGSKIPVGVVYWVTDDGRHGKVINLHDLGRESESSAFDPKNPYAGTTAFVWGDTLTDIPELKKYNCEEDLSVAITEDRSNPFWSVGQENTEIISKAQNNNLKYPAPAAKAFYPREGLQNDPKVGAGKWYLPTLGELMDLYGYNYQSLGSCESMEGATGTTRTIVNATLQALKSKSVTTGALTENYYWSSLTYNDIYAWKLWMKNGYRYHDEKYSYYYVRVSLEF